MKKPVNKAAATLFGTLMLTTTLSTFGCGDDDRDAFNDVALQPTITATTTTTTSSSSSTASGTSTSASTTNGAPSVTFSQAIVSVQPGQSAALFPNVTVTGSNTNFAGSTFTVALPASTTSGLTLTAPGNANGITSTGSGSRTLTVTLGAATTAAQLQSFLQAIQIVAGAGGDFGSSSVSIAATGPNGSVASSNTVTVNVQAASAAVLTVDPNQATDAATLRFRSLQEAVNYVATGSGGTATTVTTDGTNGGRAGSRIRLLAGDSTAATPYGAVVIGQINAGLNADPDLAGLTIQGPNAGVSAGSTPATRASEFNLTGGILVGSPNVRLDGFTILEGSTLEGTGGTDGESINGVDVSPNASNLTVANMRVIRTADSATIHAQGIVTSAGATSPNNGGLKVLNSYVQGWTRSVYLYSDDTATTNARHGDVISGNFLTGATYTGVALVETSDASITSNVIKSVGGQLVDHTLYYELRVFNDLPTDLSNIVINNNDFDGSADVDVTTTDAGDLTVDLRSNWWNAPTGPAATITGSGANTVHPALRVQQNPGTTINADTAQPLTVDPFPNR